MVIMSIDMAMTDKDKELVRLARTYTYFDVCKVVDMKKIADTDEARKELSMIASSLYHEEEWYAGLL